MSYLRSASTLPIGEAYTYAFGAEQAHCFLGLHTPEPDYVLACDPNRQAGTYDWHLIENSQGAIHLRLAGQEKWIHGKDANGAIDWATDAASAVHFALEDSATDTMRLRAIHNRDGSAMLEQGYLRQYDYSLIQAGWSQAKLTEAPESSADWKVWLTSTPPPPAVLWKDTYQQPLRHSPGFFLQRVLQEVVITSFPDPTLKTQLEFQLNHGLTVYYAVEAIVNAGLLRSHGGFYNDQEPDDELKEPPDWNEVKGGLDDAGFPDA